MNRVELATAYAASAARVLSWALVFGIVYRVAGDMGASQVALLALARGTVGLLSYLSLGLTPVLVRLLSQPNADEPNYHARIYSTACLLVGIAATVGGIALFATAGWINHASTIGLASPREEALVFLLIGVGTLLRTASEWCAGLLLSRRLITTDSLFQVAGELVFMLLSLAALGSGSPAVVVAIAFAIGGGVLLLGRGLQTTFIFRPSWAAVDRRKVRPILLLGGGVVLGQLADWLYAPLNQVLINRFLDKTLGAAYAVTIQIDGGLLLLVAAIANVLLPTAANLHAHGHIAELRRRYLLSTFAAFGLLTGGAMIVVIASPVLFTIWFGNRMTDAQAILPWVMLHTIIGGTASTGRAVLLGIGRVKAYTLSALIGGVANAALAVVIVTQTSLGLRGVVLATVVTVTLRCGLWMPWYTLRCLRHDARSPI